RPAARVRAPRALDHRERNAQRRGDPPRRRDPDAAEGLKLLKRLAVLLALGLTGCAASIQRGAVMRTTGMLSAGDYTGALSDINGAIELGDEVPDALHEAYMLKGEALEGLGRKS